MSSNAICPPSSARHRRGWGLRTFSMVGAQLWLLWACTSSGEDGTEKTADAGLACAGRDCADEQDDRSTPGKKSDEEDAGSPRSGTGSPTAGASGRAKPPADASTPDPPAPAPKPACAKTGQACADADCCAGLRCIMDGDSPICAIPCSAASACASECCMAPEGESRSFCQPASRCEGSEPEGVKENGDACEEGAECESGTCAMNGLDELHCYGTAGPNDPCDDSYDCNGGTCLQESLNGPRRVCTPGVYVCFNNDVPDECLLAIELVCAHIQNCGDDLSDMVPTRYRSDFNYCVANECAGGEMLPDASGCLEIRTSILGGTASCP